LVLFMLISRYLGRGTSRLRSFEDLDNVLYEWRIMALDKYVSVSGPLLMAKAEEFFQVHGINYIQYSNGYI